MVNKIDNFTIIETLDKVVIDYAKSHKDWSDTYLTLAIGAGLSIATYFLMKQGLKTMSYIVIAGGIIFAFQAILYTASGLSRFLQPTKNILIIDKNSRSLCSKHSPFSSKIFSIVDIQTLVVSGQKEKLFYGRNRMVRTYCAVVAKLKNGEDATLFILNTNRSIRSSEQRLETELYSKAQRLTAELNQYLNSKNQWTGYKETV